MNNYVYLRVSTDAQDTENQLHGITAYATANKIQLGETIHDTSSGSVKWQERPLGKLIESMQPGDRLLVAEISRLARSTLQVLELLQVAADRQITVIVTKSNLVLDGSIQSKIISTMMGLMAEMEREFIRARTTEALRRRAEQGLPMGRPKGQAKTTKLDSREADIKNWLQKGLNKTNIAKLLDCERNTLNSWLKRKGLFEDDKTKKS